MSNEEPTRRVFPGRLDHQPESLFAVSNVRFRARLRTRSERQMFFALILSLLCSALTGCGAARPSKYYQLTVPSDPAIDPPSTAYPIILLFGPLQSSHLYREHHIVYSSAGENM